MPSSDSEGFESADEGFNTQVKKEKKKRISSTNYSEGSTESNQEVNKFIVNPDKSETKPETTTDGWDDFDIDESEPIKYEPPMDNNKNTSKEQSTSPKIQSEMSDRGQKSQDTGWDDFDDWGQDGTAEPVQSRVAPMNQPSKPSQASEPDIKDVTDRLAATSTKTGGWGWGWGVDSLLNTATAGITTLTTHVSQGISTVLETGIGAPEPEELAKKSAKEVELEPTVKESDSRMEKVETENSSNNTTDAFPFGSILSGVTKFMETTGTKVIAGGLDTLETIGKKTMEVLQDGDPGLVKKRAMLGLDPADKPVLSQVLREAKARAEEEDRIKEEKREAKEVHYENLFDDFEGLVHLEALEMLSRQISMRIEERLRAAEPDKRQDIKETLQQVAELCEIPEEDEDIDEPPDKDASKADLLLERLQTATQDLGLKLQFHPLVNQYSDILEWMSTSEAGVSEKAIYKRAVSSLAQSTALSVEIYHKAAEMLLVKTRRSTADEADALTQMTAALTKHISELATLFTGKLNSLPADHKVQANTYITNIFLEAGNSSTYIQNAFQLTLPILQIGAV